MFKLNNNDIYLYRSILADYITQSNRMIRIQSKIQDITPLLNSKDIQNNGMNLRYRDFKIGVESLFCRLDYLVKALDLEIDNPMVNPLISSTRNQILVFNEREDKEIKLSKYAVYLYRYLVLNQIIVYLETKSVIPSEVWNNGEVQDNASITKMSPQHYVDMLKLKATELEAYCSQKNLLGLDIKTNVNLLINKIIF